MVFKYCASKIWQSFHLRLAPVGLSFLLASCSALTAGGMLETSPTPTVTPSPSQTPLDTLPPTETATPAGPQTLIVWVPPGFDPESGTQAGNIFKARLAAFSQRRPDVRVEARVKALEGPGGLLDGLTTASAAAPLALPDLVALPRPLMEAASLKGLLRSYAGQTTALDDPDWYDYARDLSSVQGSPFGLPFAGDALVLVYRPGVVPEPPPSWRDTLKLAQPLVFSAADPQALFTLLQYQAQGGKVRDEQGRPILDQPRLEQVLDFYREAETNGVMPYWLTQFQTDQQAWDAFNENRADMIVTWSSRHLANMLADTNLASVPTPEGDPYTMATGWVWAMASRQEGHQEQVVRLAEFLTESSFLARWTEAAGYLPPRPSALRAWSNASLKDTLTTIVNSSHLYPPAEFLTALGPPLEQAAVQVLKQQSDPASAAQTAVQSLPAP